MSADPAGWPASAGLRPETPGGSYVVAADVLVQLGGGPLAGLLSLRRGVLYRFTPAEAAQLAAAGVTLIAA